MGSQPSNPGGGSLWTTEHRYRELARHFPDGDILILDRDLTVLLAEGSEMQRHGFRPEHFEGRRFGSHIDAALLERVEPFYRRALAGERTEFDFSMGGQILHVRVVPIRGASGEVEALLAVSQNVTGIRHTIREREDALQRAERALVDIARAQARTRDLFHSVAAALVVCDLRDTLAALRETPTLESVFGTARVLDVNAEAITLFGLDPQRPEEHMLELMRAPSSANAVRALIDAFASGERRIDRELSLVDARGRSLHLHVSLRIPPSPDDQRYVPVTFHDVTAQRALEAQVRHAERLEGMAEVASSIAHEFNNLLAIVKNHLELLGELDLDPEASSDLDAMRAATDRAVALTKRLVDLRREGTGPPRPIESLVTPEAGLPRERG